MAYGPECLQFAGTFGDILIADAKHGANELLSHGQLIRWQPVE